MWNPGLARRGGWLLAFVGITFLSFPEVIAGRLLDVGLWVAWLGPACLLLGLRGLSPGAAAAVGFGAGFFAYAGVLHWLYVVVSVHAQGAALLGVVGVATFAAYTALFSGLFAGLASWLGRERPAAPPTLAALWAGCEYLRSFVATGFPWCTLGYSQQPNAWLMGLAPWTGVWGLCFALALGSAALVDLAGGRARRGALWLVALLGLHAAGAGLVALGPDAGAARAGAPTLRVAIAQGHIPQRRKWEGDWRERTLGIYERLSAQAREAGAALVLWPESAVPGPLDADPELRRRVAAIARDTGLVLVTGALGTQRSYAAEAEGWDFLDSAFVLDPGGRLVDRYDKVRRVPFGEYLPAPFRPFLGGFMEPLATGRLRGEVLAGSELRGVTLPGVGPGGGEVRAAIPICYELLFPDVVRRLAGDGAQLLLPITNDIHFGDTGGAHQFVAMSALRSAETGLWSARAANSGISAFIDARGRFYSRTRLSERTLLVADVPLRHATTFYVRHGDVFARACWLWVGLAGALTWRRRVPRARLESGHARR